MHVSVRLTDLKVMHPRLLWDEIIGAAVSVLSDAGRRGPFLLELTVQDVPAFSGNSINMTIDVKGLSTKQQLCKLRRTYESSRLVELAAIAIAGLGLYYAGGHELRDVALRGTSADYLVDENNYLLEIAGRSRKCDMASAWRQKWNRLTDRGNAPFYVCVVEFETPFGRLGFGE